MAANNLSFHPAANIFPLMDEDELDRLADDIVANGLMCPIETFEGKIIDGRNRYLACLRRDPKLIATVKTETNDPVAYVMSLNLHRRHLTETQKAMVAARTKEYYAAEAKERMTQGGGDKKSGVENLPHPIENQGKARDQAGAALGVSGKSVDHAEKVIKSGSSNLIAACDRGEVSVSAAAKVAELPKREQDAVLKSGEQAGNVKRAVAVAAKEVHKGTYKPPTTYPATDMVGKCMDYTACISVQIKQGYGSVAEMCASKDWHKAQTSKFAALCRDAVKTFTRLAEEFQKCSEQK